MVAVVARFPELAERAMVEAVRGPLSVELTEALIDSVESLEQGFPAYRFLADQKAQRKLLVKLIQLADTFEKASGLCMELKDCPHYRCLLRHLEKFKA